jgi:hypothetical protein
MITYCKHGHAYTDDNTIWQADSRINAVYKRCRACKNGHSKPKRQSAMVCERLNPLVRTLVDDRRMSGKRLIEIADDVGRCQSAMQKLENGQRLPTFPVLMAWANALGYEVVLKKKI